MKSGSSSAIAFGRVLQAVRKSASKNQGDVAAFFKPKLSIAAVSMAESGNRPPKTETMVRAYADALELDDDDLLELWWAMQGMLEIDDWTDERRIQRWWREASASPQVEVDHIHTELEAKKKWTPNDDFYAPSLRLFVLADSICGVLRRLLGDTWIISHKPEIGLRDPIEGRLATVMFELRRGGQAESNSLDSPELITTFTCPEPITRPSPNDTTTRPKADTISPDIAWILSSVEAMPARERAAVAGFIHGLREGAGLFSAASATTE
ncbi:hypothetical protein ART_3351 [Arthrobacter sp. PAMC 25486]|uniref:helix-turn-helix domain-containing protein n=1 Tax=Arthrobacter sp. PAMC 25486 TaxID=1494608 RepID=UPI000535C93C|nr:helix-turn-helix domain-containing protein [Arthrobacter sp. PAMC 25486]AIY02950.1 hypothetical protein ART_3351 [Arthrobacter sp. PAMC 25486]